MDPDFTGPELVAAVSNAGGFGILQAQLWPPPLLRDQIKYLRTVTDKPFGVNFVLHFPLKLRKRFVKLSESTQTFLNRFEELYREALAYFIFSFINLAPQRSHVLD